MNRRELGTVLAALSFWQANVETMEDEDDPIFDVATDGGEFRRLSSEEIDELAVRLNMRTEDPDDDPNEGAAVCFACGQILPDDEIPEQCEVCGDLKPTCDCVIEARLSMAD